MHIYIYIYIYASIHIPYTYTYTLIFGGRKSRREASNPECPYLRYFAEVLRRFVETVTFQCKMINNHCRDWRRRRIRAKTAQGNVRILAREIP